MRDSRIDGNLIIRRAAMAPSLKVRYDFQKKVIMDKPQKSLSSGRTLENPKPLKIKKAIHKSGKLFIGLTTKPGTFVPKQHN